MRESRVFEELPATPKFAARGRRNSVLAAASGVEPLGEERKRRGTRHRPFWLEVLETERKC